MTLPGPLESFGENLHAYVLGKEGLSPSEIVSTEKHVSSGVVGVSLSYM